MSKADELEKLSKLKDDGVLTDKEFYAEKKKLLNTEDTDISNNTNISIIPVYLQCKNCSYKGKLKYENYRWSVARYIILVLALVGAYLMLFVNAFLFVGVVIIAAILTECCSWEIDTYSCPKCGKNCEIPITAKQVRKLRVDGLYHK